MKALDDADLYEELDDGDLDNLFAGGVLEPELMLWGPTALENADLPDLAIFKEMHAQRLAAMAAAEGDDEEGSEGSGEVHEAVSSARFEQLLEDEYGDEETGALDDDEIEGPITLEN